MGNYYTILTNTGQSLLASALTQGTPLKLTQVAFGDGNGSDVTPSASQTALVHEVYRTTINNISVDPSNANWVTIEAILPTTVGGFYIREVGIFDNNNNLIAVGNFPDTYKPNTEEGVGNDLVINIVIEISNTSSVSLTVDPNVVVATTSEVAADIAAHNIDTSSHQDIRSLISGAIASSDASGSIAAHNADTMAHPPIQTTMNAHINNDDGHGVNDKISAHNINIQSHQDIRNEVNNIAPDNVTITKNSNGYWQTSKVLGTAVDNATVVLNSNNQISISPNQPEITSVGSLTNLTVIGQTSANGGVNTTNVSASGNITANNNITANGSVNSNTGLSTNGPLIVNGNATVSGSINSKGSLTTSSDINAGNNINVTGIVTTGAPATSPNQLVQLGQLFGSLSNGVKGGYQKLPSGLIIQWGLAPSYTFSSGGGNHTVAITFPIAFPNACIGGTISLGGPGSAVQNGGTPVVYFNNFSTTGASVNYLLADYSQYIQGTDNSGGTTWITNPPVTLQASYIAIGY